MHLKHLEASDPGLIHQIYEKIRRGEWELTGGTSIETDTLLSAEIGLVRSVQRGQALFREITGRTSTVFMAPDMFGFPSTLPTVFSQAGISAMFTTKLAWSQLNRFPHSLFRWRSPTGRELLTYQSAQGYDTDVTPAILRYTMNTNMQSGAYPRAFMPFGYSDGGGGPTEDMLDHMRYLSELPGVPRTEFAGAEDFFREARDHMDEFPTYQGELYLEMHRGTYSSQHWTKAAYARAVAAATLAEAARAYAGREPLPLENWDELIWHQFHDVLPGSSIHQVHDEAVRDLDELARSFAATASAAIHHPAPSAAMQGRGADPRGGANASAAIDGATVEAWFWPLPVPGPVLTAAPADGGTMVRTPGAGVFTPAAQSAAVAPPPGDEAARIRTLRNERSTVTFTSEGLPASMTVDGEDISLTGASFTVYPDNPPVYPAWEVEPFGRRLGATPALDSFKVNSTANRAEAVAVFTSTSTGADERLTVTYRLYPGDPELHIHVACNWRSPDRQLRFEADTLHTGGRAVYGEPFGAAFRDQGGQSGAAEAQWEVPGHQWAALPRADLSGGTALIARDRHGFSARDGRLGVTLLHPSTDPDPHAEQGDHDFYLLLGMFRTGDAGAASTADLSTPQRALQLGMRPIPVASPPERPRSGSRDAPPLPERALATCKQTGTLVWYALEPAPGGIGLVLRAFEPFGMSGEALLTVDAAAAALHGAGPDELGAEFRDLLDRRIPSEKQKAAPGLESDPTTGEVRLRIPYEGFEHYSVWIGPKSADGIKDR